MSNVEYLPSVKQIDENVLEYNRSNDWVDVPAKAKVFAHEFSVVGNLTSACRAVGIGRERGARLLKDPLVSAYVAYLQETLVLDTLITRSFVELGLLDVYEKCMGEVDVPNVTKDGDVVMAPRFNAAGAMSALKEMKPLAGMNKEEGVDGHGVTVKIDLHGFTGSTSIDEREVNIGVDTAS